MSLKSYIHKITAPAQTSANDWWKHPEAIEMRKNTIRLHNMLHYGPPIGLDNRQDIGAQKAFLDSAYALNYEHLSHYYCP